MPMQMSADHIAAQAGGFEPQRVNHWVLAIEIDGNAELLELSLATFDPPSRTIEPLEVAYANENRKVAARVTYDNVSLVVRDYVSQSVFTMLWNWQEQVHNSATGEFGMATDYKKRGTVTLYAPNNQVSRQLFCQGVWPSKLTHNTLDQGGSDQVQITVDIVVDKMTTDDGAG